MQELIVVKLSMFVAACRSDMEMSHPQQFDLKYNNAYNLRNMPVRRMYIKVFSEKQEWFAASSRCPVTYLVVPVAVGR